MKNLTKKILVMIVAIFMIMGNATANVKAEIDRTTDEALLVINGFEGGEKVTFYKLLKANYEEEDAETKDKIIKSYELVPGLVDGKDTVVLREASTRKATADDVAADPTLTIGDEIVVPEVSAKIEDLATDENGKIAASQTIEGETFDLSTLNDKVYPNISDSTLKISELVGKYPFNTEQPKETQINAISAAIASKTLNIPKVEITTSTGTDECVTVSDTSTNPAGDKIEVGAYAKAVAETKDKVRPAIYDATGIYLARIETAEGRDEVYNPVVVSVGYATNNEDKIEYKTEGINVSSQNYHYSGTEATTKKSKPGVKKEVTGGMIERDVDEAVVALDLDGDPLNYVLGQPDSLTYILKGKNQENVNDALKIENETARENALKECTTTDVEKALTDKELIHSGSEGTKFNYEVTPTLPAYPENAVNKTLWFSDSMSRGLDYVESSLEVSLTGSTITKTYDSATSTWKYYVNNTNGTYVFADTTGKTVDEQNPATVSLLATAKEENNGFKINFDYDAIPGGKDANLKLNYNAVIKTKEAIVGLEGMPNVVTMIYANNPDDGKTWDVKKTEKPEGNGLKEIEDFEIVYTYELYFKKVDEQGKPLKDAVFGLFAAEDIYYQDGENNANGTKLYSKDHLVCTLKTDKNGIGYTSEVGPGNYYLKELIAPKDYQLNNTKYPVTVNWTKATKKVSVTHETWEYTTKQPDTKFDTNTLKYSNQVGWLVKDSDKDLFYQLADYPLSQNEGVDGNWVYTVVNNETNEGKLTKGSQTIEKVWKAYIDPEKHIVTTQFQEFELTNDDNKNNNGWVMFSEPIRNTKTPELPSTGGIGTYLFTIAGVAIIATAAFMLIFRKKEGHTH